MSYLPTPLGLTSEEDPCEPVCRTQNEMMFRPGEELITLSNSDLLQFIRQYLAKPKTLDVISRRHTARTARPAPEQRRANDATTMLLEIVDEKPSDVSVATLLEGAGEDLSSDDARQALKTVNAHSRLSSEPFSEWRRCNGNMQPRRMGTARALYDPAGPYFNWLSRFAQDVIRRCTRPVGGEREWLENAMEILHMLEEAAITGVFAAGIVKKVQQQGPGQPAKWAWAGRDICGVTSRGVPCRYGHECFRKNPDHFHTYTHPTSRERDLVKALVGAKNSYPTAFPTEEIPNHLIQSGEPSSMVRNPKRKRGPLSQGGPGTRRPAPSTRPPSGGRKSKRSKRQRRRAQRHRRSSRARQRRRRSPCITRRRI